MRSTHEVEKRIGRLDRRTDATLRQRIASADGRLRPPYPAPRIGAMGTRLPKDHDHRITLDEAARLTRGQRREKDVARRGMERPYALRREALDGILSQKGCVGIRVYPAVHGDGSPTVVMVGIDEDGNDMVQGLLIQNVMDCPPFCPDSNQLNSDT